MLKNALTSTFVSDSKVSEYVQQLVFVYKYFLLLPSAEYGIT